MWSSILNPSIPMILQHFIFEQDKKPYLAEDGLHSVRVKPHLTLPAELLVVHLSISSIVLYADFTRHK